MFAFKNYLYYNLIIAMWRNKTIIIVMQLITVSSMWVYRDYLFYKKGVVQ